LVAPEEGLYSLQGVISALSAYGRSAVHANVYYQDKDIKEYVGHWYTGYSAIEVSLQHYMAAGSYFVLEVKFDISYSLDGGTPGRDAALTFMTFAKIN
jgi:hypothetical protein